MPVHAGRLRDGCGRVVGCLVHDSKLSMSASRACVGASLIVTAQLMALRQRVQAQEEVLAQRRCLRMAVSRPEVGCVASSLILRFCRALLLAESLVVWLVAAPWNSCDQHERSILSEWHACYFHLVGLTSFTTAGRHDMY